MKKLTTLSALLLLSILLSVSSCNKNATTASILQAFFGGTNHTFNSANGMYIYQSLNYGYVSGVESGTNSSLSLTFGGNNIGTYPLNPSAPSSALNLTIGGNTYSSALSGSYGTLHLTKLDAGSSWATGDFNGTFYNSSGSDSVKVTQGVISVKYQF